MKYLLFGLSKDNSLIINSKMKIPLANVASGIFHHIFKK